MAVRAAPGGSIAGLVVFLCCSGRGPRHVSARVGSSREINRSRGRLARPIAAFKSPCRRQDAAVDERRDDLSGGQSRFDEPFLVFDGAVGPPLGDREEGDRVEGDRERAAEVVVEEDVVDQEPAAGGRAAAQRPTIFRHSGTSQSWRMFERRIDVGTLRDGVGEHIAGLQLDPVGHAVGLGQLGGDLEDLGAVPDDRRAGRVRLRGRRCCRSRSRRRRRGGAAHRSRGNSPPASGPRSSPGRRGPASGTGPTPRSIGRGLAPP